MFRLFQRKSTATPEGLFVRHHDNGNPEEACTYVDGHLHGPVTRYYPTGAVRSEFALCWGVTNGPFARFHPNGRLAEEGEWIDGNPHRAWCRWWPNGQRRLEGAFHHGHPVGDWWAWHPDGTVLYRGTWFADLEEGLHRDVKAALRPANAVPEITTLDRMGWEGDYGNVA